MIPRQQFFVSEPRPEGGGFAGEGVGIGRRELRMASRTARASRDGSLHLVVLGVVAAWGEESRRQNVVPGAATMERSPPVGERQSGAEIPSDGLGQTMVGVSWQRLVSAVVNCCSVVGGKMGWRTVLLGVVALCGGAELAVLSAASLKHGHVRANTRAFHYKPQSDQFASGGAMAEDFAEEAYEDSDAEVLVDPEGVAAANQVTVESEEVDRAIEGRRVRGFGKNVLFWRDQEIDYSEGHVGYLAEGPPPPLRFADRGTATRRIPSPALPEFSVVSREYEPYLIDEPLPQDAMDDPELLSEIVIELEPHTVLSGVIETKREQPEQKVENFELEEKKTTVLRPEEVLIFFEADNGNNRANAVIPFAPATPSAETIESSAKYRTK